MAETVIKSSPRPVRRPTQKELEFSRTNRDLMSSLGYTDAISQYGTYGADHEIFNSDNIIDDQSELDAFTDYSGLKRGERPTISIHALLNNPYVLSHELRHSGFKRLDYIISKGNHDLSEEDIKKYKKIRESVPEEVIVEWLDLNKTERQRDVVEEGWFSDTTKRESYNDAVERYSKLIFDQLLKDIETDGKSISDEYIPFRFKGYVNEPTARRSKKANLVGMQEDIDKLFSSNEWKDRYGIVDDEQTRNVRNDYTNFLLSIVSKMPGQNM